MNTTRHARQSKGTQTATDLRHRAETLRSSLPQSSEISSPVPHEFGTTVEAELVALNDRYEAFVAVYDRTGGMNDGFDAEPSSKNAIELAAAHALRVKRGILQTALALPACSVLALGLQARLIASETPDWWGEPDIEKSEEACRDLLVRLISLAGLKLVVRPDVTPDELHGWLDDPEMRPSGSQFNEERAK